MEKSNHRHHLKNLFRKDKDLSDLESRSSSHLNLTKIFHKDKDKDRELRHSDSSSHTNQLLSQRSSLHLRQLPRLLSHRSHPHEGHVVGKVEKTPDGKLSIVPVKSVTDSSTIVAPSSTPVAGQGYDPSIQNAADNCSTPYPGIDAKGSKGGDIAQKLRLNRSSSDASGQAGAYKGLSTPLAISLKRNNTNGMLASTRQPVRRAETLSFGSRSQGSPNAGATGRKLSHHGHHEKIKYNPYGINKLDLNHVPSHLTLFYLKGGPDLGGRVVANPVANPNDYLPDDLQEAHVNLLEDFEYENMDKKIGDGGSGDVRIVTLCANKKKHYALKKFSLFSKETDEEFYNRAAKEYIISRRVASLRHVVTTFALLRVQSHGAMTRGWGMVMEFCSGGDLFNMIVRLGWKRTPLNERYCIFKQIAYGIKFLHEHDIVHRDLKPENVLLDHNGMAKLCDFGVSDWGHEEIGNFDSAIKLSTAYVGSPPYSPPEVMVLKDCSLSELKKHAYDPFKMDYWSLGMLLFCLVYSGVPFQLATVHDLNFRDYKFNRDRFCSDNPSFKNNNEFSKGPGSEFKWASLFQSGGAARVAWKLCDPSPTKRYNLDLLFADPWFTNLEMCIYEHPDQSVDPIIYASQSTSTASSAHNSRAPSRKNTISGHNHQDESNNLPFNPVRSMLDMSSIEKSEEGEPPQEADTSSLKSCSLLDHSPLKLKQDERVDRSNSELLILLMSSNGSSQRMRSMLDFSPNTDKSPLPRVAESDILQGQKQKHSPLLGVVQEITSVLKEFDSGPFSLDKEPQIPQPIQSPIPDNGSYFNPKGDLEDRLGQMNIFEDERPQTPEKMTIDANGVCDLGYKIKKHSHMDVTNVHYGNGLSRKK